MPDYEELEEEIQEQYDIPDPDPDLEGTVPQFADDYQEPYQEPEPQNQIEQAGLSPQDLQYALQVSGQSYADLNNRYGRLEDQLSTLVESIQAKAQDEGMPEEDIPDPQGDPVGFLSSQISALKKAQDDAETRREEEKQEELVKQTLERASKEIDQYREQMGGEVYDGAINYLVEAQIDEMRMNYPDATEQEIAGQIRKGVARQKATWISRGINPGEMWVTTAMKRGWRPPQMQQPPQQEDPNRRKVQGMRDRQAQSRSIGTVPGAPSQGKLTARRALSMDENQWNEATEGKSLAELLAGKGIPGAGSR